MSQAENSNLTPASGAATINELRRLGRNRNGYFGEKIDIRAVLGAAIKAAVRHGWSCESLMATPGLEIPALFRPAKTESCEARVYISAGIHGDEPAGPLAVVRLLEADAWPRSFELYLCPCLNPTGFIHNRRENASGTDLNRQYLQPEAHEIIAHIAWLERQPNFDLCLCLHEDWEAHGFYLYELNPDNLPSMASAMIECVAEVCPIDRTEIIDGRPACDGIIRPEFSPGARHQWPEAFFLMMHKTRLSYTLEGPSDFPLEARVNGLVAAVNCALDRMARQRTCSGRSGKLQF